MLQLIALGNTWPHGQAVKTLPSHGKNWGSIPHGATIKKYVDEVGVFFYACPSGKRRGMPFCAAVRQFAAGKFLRRAPACGKPQFPMLVPNTQYVDEVGVFFYACPSGKRRGMPFCAAVRQFAAGKFLRRAPACGKPQFPYAYTKYTHNTSTKSAYFFMPAPQGNSAACPFMPRFVNLPQANFQQFTRLPALYRPYHNASNFRIPSVCSYCNNNGLPFLNNHHRSKYHSIARLSPYKTQLSV